MNRRALTAVTAVLVGLALAPQASLSQETGGEGETNSHPRSGFWFNGGLGWGSLGCDGCSEREGGTVLTIGAGGTLSQSVMIGGSLDGWSKEVNGNRLTASTLLGTVRFYPSETGGFFLRGGFGFGTVEVEVGDAVASDEGGALLLGAGWDFRISDNVSLTPYLNGVGVGTESEVDFSQLGLSITTH